MLFSEVKKKIKSIHKIFFFWLVQVVHLNPLGSKRSNPCCSKVIFFTLIHEKCYVKKQFHNNSTTIFVREGEGNCTHTITDLNQWMTTFYPFFIFIYFYFFIFLFYGSENNWARLGFYLYIYTYIYIYI